MNQTNKEEQSSAEPGEKRARAKENIVQANTNPTQCGDSVFHGLNGVREAATLANPPRWEPYAVVPLVRLCAGGDQRWSSLPRHLIRIGSRRRVCKSAFWLRRLRSGPDNFAAAVDVIFCLPFLASNFSSSRSLETITRVIGMIDAQAR